MPFVEVKVTGKGAARVYRFYGLGRWKIKDGRRWRTINATLVPGYVLEVAAAECRPPPLTLSEAAIAALCGGGGNT